MFRAMAWKEWRQTRMVALIALAVYGLLITSLVMPSATSDLPLFRLFFDASGLPDIPFVYDNFLGHYLWISLLMAVAIGFQQTLSESGHGTYLFLLHRPASRRWLIGMKLLVGVTTYLACAAIPILVYGGWAATHAMLFEWSMTLPHWHVWFVMTLPYLGAFLAGILPGRWYASRLLPLVASAAAVYIWLEASNLRSLPANTLTSYCIVLLVLDLCMIAAILFVAKHRDFS